MFFILFMAALFFVILFVFGFESKKRLTNKKCKTMIMRFQSDDTAFLLTDMIDYHKENVKTAVRYEV